MLDAYAIQRGMSPAGNCYDNATMESFWKTLKSDTQLDQIEPTSRFAAELAVFDYSKPSATERGVTARWAVSHL